MSAPTKYRVAAGREVVLPHGLARAPSGENARYIAEETFEVDLENDEVTPFRRFLRARVRAGDLIEVDVSPRPTTSAPRKGGDL